jgi:hypothetical protein
MSPKQETLLTRAEAADFLGCSVRALDAWRKTLSLPFLLLGDRTYRFRPGDLVAWSEKRAASAASTCSTPEGQV